MKTIGLINMFQAVQLVNPVIRDAIQENWSGKKLYILAVNSISGGGGGGG